MTFHLCCTQPQRTFGFWFRALAAVGREKLGIWISFLPACNSLRGSGLKVAAERHLSAQNYTLLKHIKSHLVGHSATPPHKHTHTHRKSPQDALAFSQQSLLHTYTHTHLHNGHYPFVAGTAPLCCRHYPCLYFAPGSLDPQAPRRSFLHAGGLCLCDNRIYCFIKFVFKLPLPLSLLAFAPASATACALLLRFLLGVLNGGQMNAKNFGLLALLLDHYHYYYFTG